MAEPPAPVEFDDERLSRIYDERFSDEELAFKRELWDVLCQDFFQRYVGPDDTVLDLGAGTCEFINAIRCGTKIAVDLNPDTPLHARDARVVLTDSRDLSAIEPGSVDVGLHLELLRAPGVEARAARHARAVPHRAAAGWPDHRADAEHPLPRRRYWDYLDHHLPLSHLSLSEALNMSRFAVDEVVPRFLPYTVKDRRIPHSTRLVRMYLKLRPAWPLLGRQMLVVAHRPAD